MLFNSLAYFLLMALMRMFGYASCYPGYALLMGSVLFYSIAGWYDTAVFSVSVILNWALCRFLPANHFRIYAAVLSNIGLLGFFKYTDFFLASTGIASVSTGYINTALPLGISFYTFQILAYHIDVVRGISREVSSFKSFLLFIAFFPQLVAGPIVRSHQLLPQIEKIFEKKKLRRFRLISYGLSLFLLGLAKKVVVADSIAPVVDEIFAFGPENIIWAWVGATLFAFQIYCDFSGYSDMAIGSAYLLGIRLPVNFRTPYLSAGPREFWQRWHITLSNWIRDYLYIPLGGKRGGPFRAGVVVVLTMAIAGLWHGANITFVVWGTLWGCYILAARFLDFKGAGYIPRIIFHFIVTVSLWVLFRAPDMGVALDYYKVMFGFSDGEISSQSFMDERELLPVLVMLCGLLYGLHILEARISSRKMLSLLRHYGGVVYCVAISTMILLLMMLPHELANPFIYFRF